MDEILDKIASTTIDLEEKDDKKTEFKDLYKNNRRLNNQEERRKSLLETQKSNRNNTTDRFRGILEIVQAVDAQKIFGSSAKAYYRPHIYVAGFVKAPLSYNNLLMNSEWMVEKPSDFNENWFVVPCPKGLRVLLVASQGRTKLYNKFGKFKMELNTLLPGGNMSSQKNSCCVLDGFYNSTMNSFYVLDILAWNNQPMTDGETEFRYFWLQTQVFELQHLDVISKTNKLKFYLLPKISCEPEQFNKFMMTYPAFENSTPTLDGLLFYHKNGRYISGQTPLVLWLYPHMVQEILGADVTVHDEYNAQRPVDYMNQANFITAFEESTRNRQTNKSSNNQMETEGVQTEESPPNDMDVANGDNGEEKTSNTTESTKRGTKRRKHIPDVLDAPSVVAIDDDLTVPGLYQ